VQSPKEQKWLEYVERDPLIRDLVENELYRIAGMIESTVTGKTLRLEWF
jgi:hypothetical protein